MTIRVGGNILAGAVTGPYKANTDMDNLTDVGKNIANWSSNVTNCITEIPQDIKLELNSNNRPVLKAGSKFYRPNGNGVFDLVSNTVDLTFNFLDTQTGKYFLCVVGNNSTGWAQVGLAGSGTSTEPNTSFYYRTDDNKIYYKNNSSENIYSFPLAIVTATNGVCVIDQVFNGFGYIGSTVFALPGVKGLIPNGRNADGSLKNIEFTTSNVLTWTPSWTGNGTIVLDSAGIYINGSLDEKYDEQTNFTSFNGVIHSFCFCGSCTLNNGVISNFTPKTAFHALDYNDYQILFDIAVNNKFQVVSSLPASPDANTFYFISEA